MNFVSRRVYFDVSDNFLFVVLPVWYCVGVVGVYRFVVYSLNGNRNTILQKEKYDFTRVATSKKRVATLVKSYYFAVFCHYLI